MFNEYEWGGYLIWRLAPERQVFTDGRILDATVQLQAMLISMADGRRMPAGPAWKALLEKYGITYIVTYSRSGGGEHPLAHALRMDKEWVPVFSHKASNAMIFVKKIPENAEVIKKYSFWEHAGA